jgi:hypothetical protein
MVVIKHKDYYFYYVEEFIKRSNILSSSIFYYIDTNDTTINIRLNYNILENLITDSLIKLNYSKIITFKYY